MGVDDWVDGTENGDNVFEIGLVLAGACSAGAYTAGVIDVLIEALAAWDRARRAWRRGAPGAVPVPPHRVRIKAMSGASAGAVTAAIAASALRAPLRPVDAAAPPGRATGHPLYDAWVQGPDALDLLDTRDLQRAPGRLRALLDVTRLDMLADAAIDIPWTAAADRPYIADPLHLFLTLGNLRGVRHALAVDGPAAREHQMSRHADHMAFAYSPTGRRAGSTVALTPDAGPAPWRRLAQAALASSAFPLVLAARGLEREFADYIHRRWPARDSGAAFPDGRYRFVAVDGGVFDNEPLELCRRALAGPAGRNPRAPGLARRAVILVDPFPDAVPLDPAYDVEAQAELPAVARNVLAALLAQARFKPDELRLAGDPAVASRFLIAPMRDPDQAGRRPPGTPPPAAPPLASAMLGGFGGFLSRAFRHHDYLLGRRDGRRFLAGHFVLPADPRTGAANPLFRGWTDAMRQRHGILRDGVLHAPVIPLIGALADPGHVPAPAWPARPADLDLAVLERRLRGRADAVVAALLDRYRPGPGLRLALRAVWALKRRGWVRRHGLEPVRAELAAAGITPAG